LLRIAIDGPAGSGKSTIAKKLAKKYNLLYIDTGAFYRSAAWIMLKFGLNSDKLIEFLKKSKIDLLDDKVLVEIDRKRYDVTDAIRLSDVTMKTSEIASNPAIRSIISEQQKQIAKTNSVIMDGRDIGTVIIPDAEIKIFLTASPEERAKRRYKELTEKDIKVEFDSILKEIIERDKNDTNRDIAPLKKAPDAIEIDTTDLTIDQVISKIEKIVKEKGY